MKVFSREREREISLRHVLDRAHTPHYHVPSAGGGAALRTSLGNGLHLADSGSVPSSGIQYTTG